MVVGGERTRSVDEMTLYGRRKTWPCPGTPRVLPAALQASWPGLIRKVQIKNIKLHIVTDIKVNFNSMLGFRISNLVGGKGTLTKQLKNFSHFFQFFLTSASLPVPCHRGTHTMLQDVQPCKRPRAGPKSLRHQVFPGGPPSKYYPGPTMLNFRDRTRTGVFIVVWS